MGITRRVASLEETSQEAKICAQFYSISLEELLVEHPWNFALKTAQLPETVSESPYGPHVYAYPERCLLIRRCFCSMRPDMDIWYKVQRGSYGGKIVIARDIRHDFTTGEGLPDVWADYTEHVTDPLEFSAPFAEALAWKLASKIAVALKGDSTALRDNIMQYYGDAFSRAVTLDANEGSHYECLPMWSEYIRVRR